MTLIVKDIAGISFPKPDGSFIDLQGGCYLYVVSDSDYKFLKENFKLDDLVANGFITVGGKVDTDIDDVKQNIKDKQETAIKNNEAKNGVEIKKA